MVKRYLVVKSKLEAKLPFWFTNHKGKKFISICGFIYLGKTDLDTVVSYNDVELHSDFIEKDPDDNGYVCNSGAYLPKRLKWERFTDKDTIHFHLVSATEPDDHSVEDTTHYKWIIHLLLETD